METDALFKQVYNIIEKEVRPFIEADGGFIELESIDDNGIVYVTLGGACRGCMGAAYTLKAGVERIIKDKIPTISEVRLAM